MSVFKDNSGNEWRVYFDAFLLADIQKEAGIDLADVSAGGWAKLETDAGAVGRVCAVVCREEIKAAKIDSRSFVRTIRGEAIDLARAALIAEGGDFFPRSEWSEILSNLRRRKTARDQAETIQVAMAAMEGLSPEFRAGAMQALMEAAKEAATAGIGLPDGPGDGAASATGPDATPSPPATGSPGSAELTAVG